MVLTIIISKNLIAKEILIPGEEVTFSMEIKNRNYCFSLIGELSWDGYVNYHTLMTMNLVDSEVSYKSLIYTHEVYRYKVSIPNVDHKILIEENDKIAMIFTIHEFLNSKPNLPRYQNIEIEERLDIKSYENNGKLRLMGCI